MSLLKSQVVPKNILSVQLVCLWIYHLCIYVILQSHVSLLFAPPPPQYFLGKKLDISFEF